MFYTEEEQFWIWLACAEGIGVKRYYQLRGLFDSAAELKAAITDGDPLLCFLGEKVLAGLRRGRLDGYGQGMTESWQEQGITVLLHSSQVYPALLQQIFDPPPALFVRGDVSLLESRSLGVVGTRKCTRYGRETARKFAFEIASRGITIVSGLARGIDSEGHMGALEAKGKTVAVLGCGVDVIYPPENMRLFYQIVEQGAVISEYPPGTGPNAGNFPARNRIISGLCQGVLIVEADLKSGTMFTVDYATQQGRNVYCIPGNISSPASRGTNKLIKDGCPMVLSPEDILPDYGVELLPAEEKRQEIQLNLFEQQVVSALFEGDLSFEELLEKTGMDASGMNSALTLLELRGIIRQHAGRIFSLAGQ